MHPRISYAAPSTADLQRLKDALGLSGAQMADLAGLAGANQWRKYTGGADPREVGLHMAFFIAARLELSDADLERVFARMRELGAHVQAE